MKKKSLILLFSFLCLIVTTVILGIRLRNSSNTNRKQDELLHTALAFYTESIALDASGIRLRDELFDRGNFDSVNLKSIFNGEELKLILRLKQDHCLDCVDSIINKLTLLQPAIDPVHIIILSSYYNTSELVKLLRSRNAPFKVYNRRTDVLNGVAEKENQPILFLLDSSLAVRSIHFADVRQPQITRLYLQAVSKNLKNFSGGKYPVTLPKTASVEFDKTEHMVKASQKGEKVSAISTFKNTGKETLIITSVSSGCACTTASYSNSVVLPGHISTISISYDAKREGKFDQSVYVFSNAKQSPTLLRIKGEVLGNDQ